MFFCRPLSSPCSRRVVGSVVRQNAGTRVAPVQQARCFEAKISHEERAHLLQKISPDLRKVLETGSDADLTRYIRNMSPEEVSHLLDDPVYKKKQEEWQRLREVDRVSNLTDSYVLFLGLECGVCCVVVVFNFVLMVSLECCRSSCK